MNPSEAILKAGQLLSQSLSEIVILDPVTHVYNPLDYAWAPYAQYVQRYGNSTKRVLFLGINPGPWGMAQTGVPFGEVSAVRDWLGIDAEVGKPKNEHPKKPVEGFACKRSEISGQRLWGMFAKQFGTAKAFFFEHYVVNYCPLLLTAGANGKATNILPEKLPASTRAELFEACDKHLLSVVEALEPIWLVGVGKFAEVRLRELFDDAEHFRFGRILHPSPASPIANRGFAPQAIAELVEQGIWERNCP